MSVTRVIIIGGGFAGVRCAKTLRKRLSAETCEIILFDRENSMVYYPLLAEVAGATIGPDSVATPLRQLLPAARCRNEEVRRIDVPASEVESEVAFGEHGEENQPAGKHGLHDRQGRQRERGDVKPPGADRHRPAHGEPLGAEEVGGASQRVPDAHGRRQDRAPMLEQERDVRRERAH